MPMKAAAGVWLTAAAVLAVAAASWPAAAAATADVVADAYDAADAYDVADAYDAADANDTSADDTAGDDIADDPYMSPREFCEELNCNPKQYEILMNLSKAFKFDYLDFDRFEESLNESWDEVKQFSNFRRWIFQYNYHGITYQVYDYHTAMAFLPDLRYTTVHKTRYDMNFIPDPRMGYVYDAAPYVYDIIAPEHKKDLVYQVVDEMGVTQNSVKITPKSAGMLFALHSGPTAFVMLLLSTAVMTVGACLSSRYRPRPFAHYHDFLRKICLAVILLLAFALYICGVWLCYLNVVAVEPGLKDLAVAVSNVTRSVNRYMVWAIYNMPHFRRLNPRARLPRHVIGHWFEIQSLRVLWIYYSGYLLEALPLTYPLRSAMTPLINITSALDNMQSDLRAVKDHGAKMWTLADQLNIELRKVKRSLLQSLASCDLPACIELQSKNHSQDFNIHVPHVQIPQVSEVLDTVSGLLAQRLREDVADGHSALRYAAYRLDRFTTHSDWQWISPIVWIWKMSNVFIREAYRFMLKFIDYLESLEAYYKVYLEEYVPMIMMLLRAMFPLLTFPVLMLLGLPHCLFAMRPTRGIGNNLFTTGFGSWFIYWAILLSNISLVVCSVYASSVFTVALLLQCGLCEGIENPQENGFYRFLDHYVDIEKLYYGRKANYSSGFRLSKVLFEVWNPTIGSDGPQSSRIAFYRIFGLDRVAGEHHHRFWFSRLEFPWTRKKLEAFTKEPLLPTPITILNERAARNLRKLANTRFSDLLLDRFPSAVEMGMKQILNISSEIELLSTKLELAATRVEISGGDSAVQRDLLAASNALLKLRTSYLLPMVDHVFQLNDTCNRLQKSVFKNQTSLNQTIEGTLLMAARSERFFNVEVNDFRRFMIYRSHEISHRVLPLYRHMIAFFPEHTFLLPYADRVERTLCENVLQPINGIWICLAWSWLMLLIMMWAGCLLARHSLHTDAYPGTFLLKAYYDVKRFARMMRRRGGGADVCSLCARACNDNCLPPLRIE